ncbi:MAG: DUF167 domain-containing protein [Alphaproteobacteria bacterium]|nr:DUF167 domain-containing protein [Alphaproteobacteria bacterium]
MQNIFIEKNDSIEFFIYLTPGASKESVNGIIYNPDPAIKISIHARPTDNQANDALVKFLSSFLKIAKSRIKIKQGLKSRRKLIELSRVKLSEIEENFKPFISNFAKQLSLLQGLLVLVGIQELFCL